MTLREFGQSIVGWWDAYLTEVTTKHVLDWTIGHLILTAFGIIVAFAVIWALIEIGFSWLAQAWEKTGLPYTMDRLDKRFGPFASGLIVVAGTIAFLAFVGLLLALLE